MDTLENSIHLFFPTNSMAMVLSYSQLMYKSINETVSRILSLYFNNIGYVSFTELSIERFISDIEKKVSLSFYE